MVIAFVIPYLIRNDRSGNAAVGVPALVALIIGGALYGQYAVIAASSGRHLSEYQKATIKNELAPISSKFTRAIFVVAAEANPEASGYAMEIMTAIALSGIKVGSMNPKMLQPFRLTIVTPDVRGVFFQVLDVKKVPEDVRLLQADLQGAGIKTGLYYNPDIQAEDYALSVGLK